MDLVFLTACLSCREVREVELLNTEDLTANFHCFGTGSFGLDAKIPDAKIRENADTDSRAQHCLGYTT